MNYDRVILELLDRVSALEDEMEAIKAEQAVDPHDNMLASCGSANSSGRDTTRYILDGREYCKNRLVLAIIKRYVKEQPRITATELADTFDKSLQGSLGVVRTLRDASKSCTDYKTRYFVLPNEIIKTSTEDCVVCTQWGIANIGNMVAKARQLDMDITVVK